MTSTAYILFHGKMWKAESESLNWIKESAMPFHGSAIAQDVFILPRKT